jgi:hypothetical protein
MAEVSLVKGVPDGPAVRPPKVGLVGQGAADTAAIQVQINQLSHQVLQSMGVLVPNKPGVVGRGGRGTQHGVPEGMVRHSPAPSGLILHNCSYQFDLILDHLREFLHHQPQNPGYGRAFALQAYQVSLDALKASGYWGLAGPLLGIPSPEEGLVSIVGPAERVAGVALQKERRLLKGASHGATKEE